jgi:hypothetical protein
MVSRIVIAVFLAPVVLWCRRLPGEELISLRGNQVELVWAASGGSLVSFRFLDESTNPLSFEVTPDLEPRQDNAPYLRGHFLCLDRWGPPSKAEELRGVPFHGEAPRVVWTVDQPPADASGMISAQMSCVLPLAGMRVQRQIVLDAPGSVALVTERVISTGPLARIYNHVQHPSIAPPFLHDGTIVDSNAEIGFAQDRPVPTTRATASRWPRVPVGDGEADLRRFRDETGSTTQHDVSSFVFADGEVYGWVTACSPQHKLLLGYVWRTDDYPWLNIWRYRREGKPAARGLEFGTTGYHQPFPILVRQGQILDRRIYEPLDADQTVARSYLCLLAHIPEDFQGVASLRLDGGVIQVIERRDTDPRKVELHTRLSLPQQ